MDNESLKGNLKLALFGAGCTNDYAEKGSEAVLDIIIEERRLAKKEVFVDKVVESRLCSCNAIQELILKDANRISSKHTEECIFIISKRNHLSTFSKKKKELN